jgi:hypothetical protein
MTEEIVNGSTFYNTTHQYYLINNDNTCRALTEELSEAESEEFNVYVWCIQGTDVWQSGTVAEDVPGDQVEHTLLGVDWSSPFKMQGTNGIRGIAGGRGQIIYPMGIYNHEEVYVTTEQKAPYVYDPNDGLFYVYNIVDRPWVGMLPSNFQNVIIHPDDITNNYEDTVIDPETLTYEKNPDKKYLRYNNMYYIWKETSNDSGVYVMASRYKYSSDGSGAPGTWIGDQN